MKLSTVKTKSFVTVNLFEQHLAQALDELWQVQDLKEVLIHDDFLIQWRVSCSCILHSFYAVDSLVNYLAYEYFSNNKSSCYVEPESRKFITEKDLRDWQKSPFEKRMRIIWKERSFIQVPQEINHKINELRKLRNWIAHGNPYTIILEGEFVQTDDKSIELISQKIYPDLSQKDFELKEYKSPAYLTKDDAEYAVKNSLEICIFILSQAKRFHALLKTFYRGKKDYWLDGYKPVEEVFKELNINFQN